MKNLMTLLLLLSAGTAAAGGCCSHHVGVSGCNEKTGMLMCEDKTLSAHCTCKDWRGKRAEAPERKEKPAAEKQKPAVK